MAFNESRRSPDRLLLWIPLLVSELGVGSSAPKLARKSKQRYIVILSQALAALNLTFFVFHTALILFNVFGWISKRTRRWNLLTLGLTVFSWTVMGVWFGQGYCVCTDLHWRVRAAMGIQDGADSYLVLLVRMVSGWDPPVSLVNGVAAGVFAVSLVASVGLNLRDWRCAAAERRSALQTQR